MKTRFWVLMVVCMLAALPALAEEVSLTKLDQGAKATVQSPDQVCADYFILYGTIENGMISCVSENSGGKVSVFAFSVLKWQIVTDEAKTVPTVEMIGKGSEATMLVRLSSTLRKEAAACLPKSKSAPPPKKQPASMKGDPATSS